MQDTHQKNQDTDQLPTIVITGGGTGGHVYPALAVVDVLEPTWRILWIGSKSGIERTILEKTTIPYHGIASGKLRRDNKFRFLLDMFKVFWGIFQALFMLVRQKPVVVFSKGGYVTVPVTCAAFLLRIPIISHESDVSFGLATRINSMFSRIVCVSWKNQTRGLMNTTKIVYTGLPVRSEFFSQEQENRDDIAPRKNPILVFLGGSLGSQEINELVMELLDDLSFCKQVYHQHGSNWHPSRTAKNYSSMEHYDTSFIDVLSNADLIISRAGASVVHELAAIGTPVIFIPLHSAVSRGEQVDNAQHMESIGAAKMLIRPNAQVLYETIQAVLQDPSGYDAMRKSMRDCTKPDAAQRIAELIKTVAKTGNLSIQDRRDLKIKRDVQHG